MVVVGEWAVGQTVDVKSRTWVGINKPGGCAIITKVHFTRDGRSVIESIDVKYVVSGCVEKEIDPAIVSPYDTLDRGVRKRRGREFLLDRADDVVKKAKKVIQKRAKKQTAAPKSAHAKKTKERDQSTSPSTPITPEHPSLSKAKSSSKTADTTLPVPSLVIVDRFLEVSPLPGDRVVEDDIKSTVARRGLFGCSGSNKVQVLGSSKENLQLPTNQLEDKKFASKPTIPVGTMVDSLSEASSFHKTAKDVSKAHSAAMKDFLTHKQQGRRITSKFGAKKAPLVDRKPASMPRIKNPSVATTEAGIVETTTATKTSLKNVFDYERRQAKEFLDQVCRAPPQCTDADDIDTESKEKRLNTSASEDEEDVKPAANNRREKFLNFLSTVRHRFDNDDALEETVFRTLVDYECSENFSSQEVDENLAFLEKTNKLMRTDGMLYMI